MIVEVHMDINAMYSLSYGLFVLTAREGEKDNGCIVNTVMQVTIEPNRIVAAIDKRNYTHGMVERTGKFNVSVLGVDSKFETYKHWGFRSGANVDKAKGMALKRADNGIIYIEEGCNAYISAKTVSTVDLGTHTLFLADVEDARVVSNTESVTYGYYRKNIKPSDKPKASGFVCTVCGYVYEGNTLPNDFICPWCKHPASDFISISNEKKENLL
jgi:flavin reductase (DIM6/NTAB) family NADH-FMN oxidoreductase RutF